LLHHDGNQQSIWVMSASEIQVTSSQPPAPTQTTAAVEHGFSFHNLLSAMNPLQYLPIVGTIYRAATGDVIPEALRLVGSLVVSGLIGGPLGVIANIAETIAEKVTGIDPEKIVAERFHTAPPAAVAQVGTPPPAVTSVGTPAGAPADTAASARFAFTHQQLAFTPQQLMAYGVQVGPSGTLKPGKVEGADVLNTLELVRLDKAVAAYSANQNMPFAAAARSR
jgi:hypothetical protein